MEVLANWVEALGTWAQVILVLISFGFVWYQIRELRRSLESSASHSIYQMMVDIDKFFAEKPQLRGYFYRGKGINGLDEDARDQVFATAEMITDWFYHAYQQRSNMPAETSKGYRNYMQSLYANSAALREYIAEHQDWYPKGFVGAISGHLETVANADSGIKQVADEG